MNNKAFNTHRHPERVSGSERVANHSGCNAGQMLKQVQHDDRRVALHLCSLTQFNMT